METMDIVFDIKIVDTQLAKTYIKSRPELHSIGFNENGTFEYDKFNNKIYITDIDEKPINTDSTTSYPLKLDKLLNLAKIIEKNADLFCQLEYLIRGIPVDDVKKSDLKLIIDNLLYCSKANRNEEVYNNIYCDRIALLNNTPLAVLGFIAQSLCYSGINKNNSITIISNKDTATISSLFVDLCHQVGFKEVFLQLVSKYADCSMYNILEIEEISSGCIGIVTNKSDVDSAVDTFISSTILYPWRVNKIFVQESVLERFKRALAWKAERQSPGRQGEGVLVSCATSYRCRDKVFLVEATDECIAPYMAIEAYRTVRELLALLGSVRPFAASLWSSDVAETLEIAHGLDATLVWINGFGDFRGPPGVSQAFYSVIDVHFGTRTVDTLPELNTIETLKKSWCQLSSDEREFLLMQQCNKYSFYRKLVEKYDFQDSFVHVIDNCEMTGTITPTHIWQIDFANTLIDMSLMTYLIKGGGLLVNTLHEDLKPLFQDILKIKDIPIVYKENSEKNPTYKSTKVLWKPCYKHKVIWTNYGTMFAN